MGFLEPENAPPTLYVQTQEGDEAGSWWNPKDIHADTGGRLFQTALGAMTLEVYAQYLSLYKVSAESNDPASR